MNRIAKLGDVYCLRSERYDKWAVYKVVKEDNTKVALMALDWFSFTLPSENELLNIKPLDIEGEFDIFYTMYKGVPNRFIYVGNIKTLEFSGVIAYGEWPEVYLYHELKYSWQKYSEEEKKKYLNAEKSNGTLEIQGKTIAENSPTIFLAEKFFEATSGRIFEREIENFSNWSALEKLGALREIHYEGSDEEILSYIAKRKMIKTLNWKKHGKKQIDISKTNLQKLILEPEGLEEVILNENLRELLFSLKKTDLSKLKIKDPNEGRYLSLDLIEYDSEKVPDLKLPHLSRLAIWVKNIDAKQVVTNYPNLQSLCIWGGSGNIYNISELGKLKKLRWLQLNNLFGFKAEEFPRYRELESIENLWLTSMSAKVCKIIKKDYKDCLQVEIKKTHSEKWIEANVGVGKE